MYQKMNANLLETMDEAVRLYADQVSKLLRVAEHRYDKNIFPTFGQYDWLSAVLLYCIIRYVKPLRVIEVSTSSGYSSIFSATALKDNKFGKLYTFEISESAAKAASINFKRFGLSKFINLTIGDARKKLSMLNTIRGEVKGKEIIFLDSEHTKDFVRNIIPLLLRHAQPDSLFHVHDVLPKNAKVMYKPLSGIYNKDFQMKVKVYWGFKKIAPFLVSKSLRNFVKPIAFNTDGTTESRYIHKLAARIPSPSQLYVYDLIDRYPQIEANRFAKSAVGRCDVNGKPLEWNESWWVRCKELKEVLNKK